QLRGVGDGVRRHGRGWHPAEHLAVLQGEDAAVRVQETRRHVLFIFRERQLRSVRSGGEEGSAAGGEKTNVILSPRTAQCADGAVMTRPLTRRFAAPSPRFAGRGISCEVLLPACGEKVAGGRMRGVIRSREDGEGSRRE